MNTYGHVLDTVINTKKIFKAFYLLQSDKSSPVNEGVDALSKIWRLCDFST